MENEKISAEKVYSLIDSMRRELKADIMRVEAKFDTMEAGRLTRLEVEFAEFKAIHTPIKKIVYGLVGFIFISFVGALIVLTLR